MTPQAGDRNGEAQDRIRAQEKTDDLSLPTISRQPAGSAIRGRGNRSCEKSAAKSTGPRKYDAAPCRIARRQLPKQFEATTVQMNTNSNKLRVRSGGSHAWTLKGKC